MIRPFKTKIRQIYYSFLLLGYTNAGAKNNSVASKKGSYMNSLEWEVFKRTGKIEHYLLMKESDHLSKDTVNTEFSEEIADVKPAKVTEEE